MQLQQLYYYGTHGWNNEVRSRILNDFGGSPKDLLTSHDYDPKVNFDIYLASTFSNYNPDITLFYAQIFDGTVDIGTGVPSDAAQYWRPHSLDSPYFDANGY